MEPPCINCIINRKLLRKNRLRGKALTTFFNNFYLKWPFLRKILDKFI